MPRIGHFIWGFTTFIWMSLGSLARADLSPTERATAEAMFQRGVALVEDGQYAEACATFTATLDLEKGLGTMLRLADCYDRQGKTASAWALFKEVAASAGLANDVVREQIANERVRELESRLSLLRLTVVLPNAATASVNEPAVIPEVMLDGSVIPEPMWDAPFPMDPGVHPIEVSAPGYQPWLSKLEVPTGPALKSVIVPALSPEPAKLAPVDVFASRTGLDNKPKNSTKAVNRAQKDKSSASQGSSYLPLGYVFTVVGLVAVGTSAYLTYQAHDLNQESRLSCQPDDPNACTPNGVELRNDAQWYADAATIAGVSGGILAAAGLSIIVFSPSAPKSAHQRGAAPLGVGVRGVW